MRGAARRHSPADDADERDDPRQSPGGRRVFRLDNLTSQSVGREKGEAPHPGSRSTFDGQEYHAGIEARWKTNEDGHGAPARWPVASASSGNTLRVRPLSRRLPGLPAQQRLGRTRSAPASRDPKVYVVQTNTKVVERCMLMTTDPGDLVLDPTCGSGHDGRRGRAVGSPLDHHRHEPSRARPRAHPPHGRALPVLPARGLARGREARGRADRRPAGGLGLLGRRPQGLRLQARPAHHAEVDRQQPRHPRGHVARGDRRRHPPPRRHRAALRPALRGQLAHPRDRAVHGREPLAAPGAGGR